jgi:Rieske Fe-S protein
MTPPDLKSDRLWAREFPIDAAEEKVVTRRQFTKFLVLTSLAMFVGNLCILVKARLYKKPFYPQKVVAIASQIAPGDVQLFRYPTDNDPCLLIHLSPDKFVAYSQKCTHLTCPVFFAKAKKRLECPCHEGYFSAETGEVLEGPPPRPLPRVILDRRGDELIATGMEN